MGAAKLRQSDSFSEINPKTANVGPKVVYLVILRKMSWLTLHPVPGRANFRRDFFRGSVFVIMTILRGTILAQVHHHFPNSH